MKRWSNVNAIYQIYPRSFKDTDSNGIGDISGVIDRLDYIKGGKDALGIDAIWLSPFYPSTMADFGYDITDYCDVDPLFGTLNEFKRLLEDAHARQIRIMIDFVPNHTSFKHSWFLESLSSRTNSKRDWYIWRDPQPDGSAPNNWLSIAGGSAWEYDKTTNQYYLHSFLKEQPDLNWENAQVRQAMKEVIDFWLSMGVDGLRVDAVRWMAKDQSFADNPLNPDYHDEQNDPYGAQIHTYSQSGPQLLEYLTELVANVERYDDRILLFEAYPDLSGGRTLSDRNRQYLDLYKINPEVAMPFNFEGLFTDFSADSFRKFVDGFQSSLPNNCMPVYCFSNHDQSRIVSRFGRQQSRLISMLQLTLPGLPVVYYGDELGMEDVPIEASQVQDSFEKQNPGHGLGRDPQRTPMQWSAEEYAGFSQAKPWLPVANDSIRYNVASEMDDKKSFLSLYRNLLGFRDRSDVLRDGTYVSLQESNDQIFAYAREKGDERVVIILNISDEMSSFELEDSAEVVLSTDGSRQIGRQSESIINLAPYEALIVR